MPSLPLSALLLPLRLHSREPVLDARGCHCCSAAVMIAFASPAFCMQMLHRKEHATSRGRSKQQQQQQQHEGEGPLALQLPIWGRGRWQPRRGSMRGIPKVSIEMTIWIRT